MGIRHQPGNARRAPPSHGIEFIRRKRYRRPMARKHLNIGGKIQARRKAMGLSQEDLAQLTGVSRQSVTKWETGQSAPDLDRLVEVADVLGVSLDFLLREPQQVCSSSSSPSLAVADSPSFAEDSSPGRVRCSQRDRFFSEWDGPCRCCGARRFPWTGPRCSIRKRSRWPFGYHETFLGTAFRDFGTFLRLAGNAPS